MYGNVSRNAALEYLVNDFMLCILILSSKYVVAREIKVTTKVEVTVTAAKPSVVKTAEDALRIADTLEALKEWDIL